MLELSKNRGRGRVIEAARADGLQLRAAVCILRFLEFDQTSRTRIFKTKFRCFGLELSSVQYPNRDHDAFVLATLFVLQDPLMMG